jgi:Domain of unknown function (DUF5615)
LDHNVARELADHLRGLGHVAHTARELGMDRAGDEAHLALAARSDWTLITHNAGDFRLLDAAWRQWMREWGVEKHHAGILILFPPIAPLQAAQVIGALLETEPTVRDTLWMWRRRAGWSHR